jgi:hypothetical protein
MTLIIADLIILICENLSAGRSARSAGKMKIYAFGLFVGI